MNNDKDFFHTAKSNDQFNPSMSIEGVYKPEPTELQKAQIWAELLLQEQMFKDEKESIFKTYK